MTIIRFPLNSYPSEIHLHFMRSSDCRQFPADVQLWSPQTRSATLCLCQLLPVFECPTIGRELPAQSKSNWPPGWRPPRKGVPGQGFSLPPHRGLVFVVYQPPVQDNRKRSKLLQISRSRRKSDATVGHKSTTIDAITSRKLTFLPRSPGIAGDAPGNFETRARPSLGIPTRDRQPRIV